MRCHFDWPRHWPQRHRESNMTKLRTAAVALAGVLAISAASATSASAQWRGHHGGHWGPGIGIGAGIAAGALVGAAVAARPYGGYYYDEPGYVYDAPYAYEVAPVYPGYGYYRSGRCYTDEGYGRRRPCGSGQ
jgi:hypothetical protein